MKSGMKKSLYLGLAAISLVAAGAASSTTASAKSYATVKTNKTLTTTASTRNVTLTGTNAIYTKAGTVKGAKLVATKTTAKKLAASTSGKNNFRAYKVATTNRGSVYYKVVSFDGTYRGWVYGGKSTSAFAGGVKSYDTTTSATAPSSTAKYKLSASTSSTANTLFYSQPQYAEYKIGRAKVSGSVLTSTSAYADSTFTFSAAEKTSREGDTWYQIASVDGSTTNGLVGAWVKSSNVSQTNAEPTATDNNSVTVEYETSNGNVVGTASDKFIAASGTSTTEGQTVSSSDKNTDGDTLTEFATANVPSGYTITSTSQLASATYGGTTYVTVAKADTSKVSFVDGNYNSLSSSDFADGYPSLTTTQQEALTASDGTAFSSSDFATSGSIGSLFSGTSTDVTVYDDATTTTADTNSPLSGYYGQTASNGRSYFYVYDATKTQSANSGLSYGDTIKIVFDKYYATTPSTTTTTDTGNTNYVD